MNRKTLLAIALMFITYWLFNTYIFPKPQPKVATSTQTQLVEEENIVAKPTINLTKDGIIIFSADDEAELRYNFEGTEPTLEDPIYSGLINYNENVNDISKLRVKAFSDEISSATAYYTKAISDSEVMQSSDIEEVVLENEFIKVYLSPNNAVITKAVLKDFPLGEDELVNLIPENTVIGNVTLDQGKLANCIYFKEVTGNSVKFFLKDNNNAIIFSKEYILKEEYDLALNLYFGSNDLKDNYAFNFDGIADTENLPYKAEKPEKYFKSKLQDYKFFALDNNQISAYPLSKLKKTNYNSESKYVQWAALRSKYFVMSLFANEVEADRTFSAMMQNESPAFTFAVSNPDFEQDVHAYQLYLGPVVQEYLENFDSTLMFERVVERSWTWLHWLSKLFEIAFKYIGKLIPNYGLVLIVFAILIKLMLYPLTHKSFENSIKMQRIQPLLNAVQKQYKSDPMKMQKEMGKIKKEHGVSTLGGCVPMLIQMPIFFALYPTLRYSIALRGASFVGWLQDLSSPDPYFVLPILMGIFMFIQQKMMMAKQNTDTKDLDEKQAAMMQSQKMMAYVMPVMMFFIFRSLPAGLVLYWTVFNILSIIQQHFINKKFRG